MAGLTCRAWGPDGAPKLVLLHGFMGSGEDWSEVAQSLPQFRVLAPDLPGHGRSTGLPEQAYTLKGAADLCTALLDADVLDGGNPVALAGYSMGGRVAQEILAAGGLPPTAGLCLIGAHPGYQSSDARAQRLASDGRLADSIEKDFESTLDAWLALPLFSTLSQSLRQRLKARRLAGCKPAELARSLRGLSTGHQPDRRPALAANASRIRLVAGEHDERYIRLLAGLGQEVRIVAGADHNVLAERPEELAAILRDLAVWQRGDGAGA